MSDSSLNCLSDRLPPKMVLSSEILFAKCAQFRQEGQFIDVRLEVGENIFPAHRIVLAANSDYFYAMFTDGMKESNQEVIELKDESITPDTLKIVIDSIYTGDLYVSEENVFEVLAAADHLQVASVVEKCCDFLKKEFVQLRFDLQNYCLLCTVADKHGLRDLQEAAEHKMASMYKHICESEEFLSSVGADQLLSILSRDDLSAPSETFVFKSVIQWIKHKKEERMAVAAKVIGAVHLGLVDIRVVIEELNTEEMQRDPEIHMQLHDASLYNNMPSCKSKFAEERTKSRSTNQALIAVLPQVQMKYFDVENKTWKTLPSTIPSIEAIRCNAAVSVGSTLFVAGVAPSCDNLLYRYDTESNAWEMTPHSCNGSIDNLCIIEDHIYVISSDVKEVPQRQNTAKRQWQSISNVSTRGLGCNNGVTFQSKLFVLYGIPQYATRDSLEAAVLQCFDPAKNEWEVKARTCYPHFNSILFMVNGKLFVAGGFTAPPNSSFPGGGPAPVEVFNETDNTWSVVEQKHIPANSLGAVEVEGRVYFIINKFPIDSGIRIPPGDRYPVPLGEWEKLGNIDKTAVLCYLPVKRESLKTE